MCVRENMLFPDNVSILGLDLTNVHGLAQNFNCPYSYTAVDLHTTKLQAKHFSPTWILKVSKS